MSHFADLNNGEAGTAILKLAIGKMSPDMVTIFFKGILCNMLVCLGVWLAYAGRSVTDKMAGMVLPVACFVAAGFEHCVANMFFLPIAWVLAVTGHVPAGLDVSAITLFNIVHNIIPGDARQHRRRRRLRRLRLLGDLSQGPRRPDAAADRGRQPGGAATGARQGRTAGDRRVSAAAAQPRSPRLVSCPAHSLADV